MLKSIKYPGINLPKETKDLYSENCKILMKEIKNDTNRWRCISCFWTGRINTVEMPVLPRQSMIQCNSFQITNSIFHRTRTKNFTIQMETQKTPNSQRNLEKQKQNWRNQAPWLQTILQSYGKQDSMVLVQDQKYRSMEHDRSLVIKPHTYGHLI